jgi:predicted transcriptional regulator
MAGNYFVLPNEIFSLDLSANAIAVYAYLMRLENRKTHCCWAKQKTIGDAVSIKSDKTIRKALNELEDKELIYRENMSMNHNGQMVNGIQKFTIRPINDAVQSKQWQQFENIGRAAEEKKLLTRIENYNAQHPEDPVQFTAS